MGDLNADVVIVGAGMVGMTTAVAFARLGLNVVMLDRQPVDLQLDAAFDGRSSAIAWSGAQMYRALGVWGAMEARAQPILDIRVSDGPARLHLHFDHRDLAVPREVGDQEAPAALGYIIENRALRDALVSTVRGMSNIDVLAPVDLAAGADLISIGPSRVGVSLTDGRKINAAFAIAADGRASRVRSAVGIRTLSWFYRQTAIVCTAAHDRPHDGVAHERFLPAGPFALLPMVGTEAEPNRSSVVWTEDEAHAPAMMTLPDAEFGQAMTRRFGPSLGAVRIVGRRWSHPVGLLRAARLHAGRVVLVGDAAHSIHPIAGQGLNLGLRDVAALAECVAENVRLGLDPIGGDALARYARWRGFDILALQAATDGLNRLFATDFAPVRLARDLGLAAVDRIPPLKRVFMRQAMGIAGDLPRLLQGEPLTV